MERLIIFEKQKIHLFDTYSNPDQKIWFALVNNDENEMERQLPLIVRFAKAMIAIISVQKKETRSMKDIKKRVSLYEYLGKQEGIFNLIVEYAEAKNDIKEKVEKISELFTKLGTLLKNNLILEYEHSIIEEAA